MKLLLTLLSVFILSACSNIMKLDNQSHELAIHQTHFEHKYFPHFLKHKAKYQKDETLFILINCIKQKNSESICSYNHLSVNSDKPFKLIHEKTFKVKDEAVLLEYNDPYLIENEHKEEVETQIISTIKDEKLYLRVSNKFKTLKEIEQQRYDILMLEKPIFEKNESSLTVGLEPNKIYTITSTKEAYQAVAWIK